jgi:S-DNA-T family DNA segregation ATPase FtsK/SpoIIIE
MVSIEIGKENRETVKLETLLATHTVSNDDLVVPIGLGLDSKAVVLNISKAPHCIVSGQTGSGKSVAIHSIIKGLIDTYDSSMLQLAMIDPKRVELSAYSNSEYLHSAIAEDVNEAQELLDNLAGEMNDRYVELKKYTTNNIDDYNLVSSNKMKKLVIVIDELADLILSQGKDKAILSRIMKIAQLGRACGIHLILATQRPDSAVIDGGLKVNIPTRIAFRVASSTDSRVILDENGAETLLGKGDAILKTEAGSVRFQCAIS